jgi:hypothetical protein
MLPIYLINHALRVNQLSVYTEEERFTQTMETIASIEKYAPGLVFMFDNSPELPNEHYVEAFRDVGVNWIYSGGLEETQKFSKLGMRSIAETHALIEVAKALTPIIEQYDDARIIKLSGRYRLNDNFIIDHPEFKDAFVFQQPMDSWMTPEKQLLVGASKLYNLRLWHMDVSLWKTFCSELPNILNDCLTHGIDIEHSYWKNLHKYKVVPVDKVGVNGNIAPSGDFIDE